MEELLVWGTPTAASFLTTVGLTKTSPMNMGEQLLAQWTYTKAQRVAVSLTRSKSLPPRPITLYTEHLYTNTYDDVAVVAVRSTHERIPVMSLVYNPTRSTAWTRSPRHSTNTLSSMVLCQSASQTSSLRFAASIVDACSVGPSRLLGRLRRPHHASTTLIHTSTSPPTRGSTHA
jgi:hypothetical protein